MLSFRDSTAAKEIARVSSVFWIVIRLAFTLAGCATVPASHKAPVITWLESQNRVPPANSQAMKSAIEKLSRQLAEYSHKDLAVVIMPRHSFAAGQAHGENAIILDPLDTEGDNNLFAYRIAHEWAHEALGHEPSAYNLDGQTYQFRRSSVLDENEADRFAGDFLAQYGYSIGPVCNSLQVYQAIPWDSRTPGAMRCRQVKDSYQQTVARMNATQIAQVRSK